VWSDADEAAPDSPLHDLGLGVYLAHSQASALLPDDYELPESFWRARQAAEVLSRGLDFVRVDLMVHDDEIYICEMTLYPGSGFSDELATHTAPYIERGWIAALERSWFLSTPQPWPASRYAAALRNWRRIREAELAQSP
jgi:hypothetical protein